MAWWKKILIVIAAGWLALLPVKVKAQTAGEIAKQLICMCGCTSVLDSCTHVECMVRETMLASIKDKLNRGQSEAQIIQSFVAQYGEKVLASPPKRGFNLTAWILPFVAILAGGAAVFFIIKKWVGRGRTIEAVTIAGAPENDAEYERRLEKELKDFEMRGYR